MSIVDSVFSQGSLVQLNVSVWGAHKKIRRDDLLLPGISDDNFHLGHKKLLPKGALDGIRKIEQEARASVYARTVNFPVSGARFVTKAALKEVEEKLAGLKAAFNSAVDALLGQYDVLREKQVASLFLDAQKLVHEASLKQGHDPDKTAEWLAMQDKKTRDSYPDVDKLRKTFGFSWSVFSVSQEAGGSLDLGNEIHGWVANAAKEAHIVIGTAAKKALESLNEGGKVSTSGLDRLVRAVDTFRALDITGGSEWSQAAAMLKDEIGDTGTPLTQEEAAGAVRELMSKLASLADEQVSSAVASQAVEWVSTRVISV